MAKARTIFIFEGPDAVTFCKGYGLVKNPDAPYNYNTKVKQKGIFTPYIPVMNIDEMFIGNAKKLMISDQVQDGWEVIRIRKDFLTHESSISDIPPNILSQLKSLRNENEMWKRKYFDAVRLNQDREQKDRFRGRVSEEFDFVAKQKNKFFGSGDAFGSPFASRWGLPLGGVQNQGGSED